VSFLFDISIAPFHWQGLLTTLLCGAIVGLERQLCGKPAGIRTSCLICMGTYIFVAGSIGLTGGSIDPSRVIGQVVTGIGFLGAGVILTRDGAILGVTSAATIWVLAAIGVVTGLEHHTTAIVLALVTVGILVGVNLLERSFRALRRGVHAQIVSKYQRRRDDDPAPD
jgi:putative Mg2+ transporter-C (MgtC) family protein